MTADETSSFDKTNTYLISSDETILIDPASQSDKLDAKIKEIGGIDHVMITHTHPDHISGLSHYGSKEEITVWGHQSYVSRFEDMTGIVPDATFYQNTTVDLGDEKITIDYLPGHAPDHVAFRMNGRVISGDLLFAHSSSYIGRSDGDMRAYLTSLRRLLAISPTMLYPGHGKIISDPSRRITEMIKHRIDREKKILAAVQNGYRSLPEIVNQVYEKDIDDNATLAAETVKAHLQKLAIEKKINCKEFSFQIK
ncbi:MAG: MBL fold metallo-hydrolase [Halobacteriaceae archaeon]